MVNVVGLELMEQRHHHAAKGVDGQEDHSPLRGVAATQGNLVAGADACVLKEQVEFFDFASQVFILQRLAVEVGQRRAFPVFADHLFDYVDDILFHGRGIS